jgi:CheY-like chemotaxis protein
MAFMQLLGTAIDKDPASLENWLCLHISHITHKPIEWVQQTLNRLRDTHRDLDCEVIHCHDGDILFVSRHLQVDALYAIADDFIRANCAMQGDAGHIALYDMCRDWRIMKDLLLNKTPLYVAEPTLPNPVYDFGEVGSLRDVFAEAKKLRVARAPVHVMIVEDDALTRRMVASAFKENYALINATNAQEAIENYLTYAPDIVFLDIGLPDTSGFDVLRQIMASDPNAYVVMFSGNGYLDNVATALCEGASGFVSKPFRKDKMYRYIQESALHHRQHSA